MAIEGIWVHGSTATILSPGGGGLGFPQFTGGRQMEYVNGQPWTDITGSRSGSGATFHGRAGQRNTFTFSIPSPAIKVGPTTGPRTGVRASLITFYVLYSTDVGVHVTQVQPFDGGRAFIDSARNPTGLVVLREGFGTGDHSGDGLRVEDAFSVLQEGVNMFSMPATQSTPVFWGLGIQVEVFFRLDGTIRFAAAGADFAVQDS